MHAAQEAENHLSAPVNLQSLECLRDAHVMLRGYSEMRQVGAWLHQALGCRGTGLTKMDECQRGLTPPGEPFPPASAWRNLSACREETYARHPFKTWCPALNVTLHYEWKSRMWSEHDASFRRRATRAARAAPKTLVVLNGGPHHFAQFADHSHSYYWALPDSFDVPQHWVDDYLTNARTLFRSFAPPSLPPNVCALWRTSNIGPRLGESGGQNRTVKPARVHHPSARNGLHEWLNRFAVGLAREAGVGVLDLTDLTILHPPPPKRMHTESKSVLHATTTREPARSAAAAAAADRVSGRRLFAHIEGDLYHGFNSSLLLLPFVARACAACQRAWAVPTGMGTTASR
jgi:hypothetical protein